MSTPATTRPRRRVKKRILIPVIVLGVAVLFLLWLYVRGTWASDTARNPQAAAEGTITQLYRTPAGNTLLRCAIVVDAPPDSVWAVIQDYGKHASFLPYVSSLEAAPREEGTMRVQGIVHSRLWGDWPFTVDVVHKKVSDKEYVASWDNPSDTLPVNRGTWTVTGLGPRQSLIVNALEVEAAGYPTFFVRNLVIHRMHKVVSAMRDEVMRRQGKE